MTLFDLSGRTALVTGSTRGLGLALAGALADAGARVAVNGRTSDACEARAAEIEGAVAAPFDVTSEEAVAAGIAQLGRVDVLVSNAGMTLRKPLERFEASLGGASDEVRDRFYRDNFLDLMGSAGGHLVAA